MAVKVIRVGNELQFISEGKGDDHQVASYLCDLTNAAKQQVTKSMAAKAYLGEEVLKERDLKAEKVSMLKSQAEKDEARSMDTGLAWEMRELAAARAASAREEARQITAELDGKQAG